MWNTTGCRPHTEGPLETMPTIDQRPVGSWTWNGKYLLGNIQGFPFYNLTCSAPPLSPGQADASPPASPAQTWSEKFSSPVWRKHSASDRIGTVAAWRTEECGEPSSLPVRPQPTTVP